MAKYLLDELMDGLIAAAEQVKKLAPSENENVERKIYQGLQSTQVKSIFDLSCI